MVRASTHYKGLPPLPTSSLSPRVQDYQQLLANNSYLSHYSWVRVNRLTIVESLVEFYSIAPSGPHFTLHYQHIDWLLDLEDSCIYQVLS